MLKTVVVALRTWVQFDRKLAVGLFDFQFGCGGRYAEGVVVCGFYYHDFKYAEWRGRWWAVQKEI